MYAHVFAPLEMPAESSQPPKRETLSLMQVLAGYLAECPEPDRAAYQVLRNCRDQCWLNYIAPKPGKLLPSELAGYPHVVELGGMIEMHLYGDEAPLEWLGALGLIARERGMAS